MALNATRGRTATASSSARSAVPRCQPVRPCRRALRVTADVNGAAAAAVVEKPAAIGTEKTGPNFQPLRDINKIMQTLPHRYPFLLVDRVVEWEKEKYAVGYKCVTINDNFFTGHFPERPIMPGVLQVEAMAQLAGLVMLDPDNQEAKGLFFFGGIENCRFRRPVVPGDVLMMRAEVTKFNKRFGIVKVSATGYVGSELAIEADLTLAMGK